MTTLPLTPAALCLAAGSAIALTGFVNRTDAHETVTPDTGGLRCVVVTHDLGDAVEISGKVTSDHAVSGAYALTIRQSSSGGQAMIDQSGDFTVAKGRTVTLGQATLGGAPQSYRAELTLTVDGQRLRCHATDDLTDI